jgi:hypothetical protein
MKTMETGTMAEQRPTRQEASARSRRRRSPQRIIGAIYLAIAVAALLFGLVTWWIGRLNPINALVFALAVAGTLPVGILALQGDYLDARGMDEGQRAMNWAAQSDAFYVAYLGLYALFFSVIFFPALRDVMPVAIGILLLLISLTWLGGYMWRRWRP